MKKYLPYLISFLLLVIANMSYAIAPPSSVINKEKVTANSNSQNFNKKNWEAKLGRKLNYKERISLRIVQKRLKKKAKNQTQEQNKDSIDVFALTGFIASLLGVLLSILLMPLGAVITGVVAIVLSAIGRKKTEGLEGFRKKGRDLATAGFIIGIMVTAFWVGLVSIALVLLS